MMAHPFSISFVLMVKGGEIRTALFSHSKEKDQSFLLAFHYQSLGHFWALKQWG